MSCKKHLFIKGMVLICIMLGIIMVSNYSFYAQAPSQESPDELVLKVLGLESSGDCIIVKYNDFQILIDASQPSMAEEKDSWPIITKNISACLEDDSEKIWDYMIFTHPDKDHIGNAKNVLDLFYKEDNWKIGTIIDFDMKEAPPKYFKDTTEKYKEKRDALCKENGVEYFSASYLSSSNKVKEYKISNDLSLYILYNYYDDYKTIQFYNKNANVLSDKDLRNNISVCVLIQYKTQKLLFTGDIEEEGEEKLVENHPKLLENVTFFKANHHGSDNANSEIFLDVIKPDYISITKMNTNDSTALGRFIHYTDYIYPTYVIYDPYPSK